MHKLLGCAFAALILTSAVTAPATAEAGRGALLKPKKAKKQAPDNYRVRLQTTKGTVVIAVHRDWARVHEVPPAAPVGTVATPEPLGGGYWGPLGRPPPAPDDGRWLTWTGAVMLPLGVLRVGMGGVFLYGAAPSRCGDWFGDDFANEPGRCGSLATYGYWGIAFGAVMAVTGAVLLGVGAHRARAYRRWKVQWGWRGMAPHGRAGHSSVRPPWHVEGPAVLRF